MNPFAPDPWSGGRSAGRSPQKVHRMKQAGANPFHP
jgi:hypothetical protein